MALPRTVQPAKGHPLAQPSGLALLGCLTGLTPLAIDAYLPALPELAHDLHASSSQAQLTLSALLIGLAVGQAVAGPLSDAVGRRRPVLVGLALFSLTSLLCAFAPDVRVLIALRFLQGASGAAGVVCARAIVRDLFEGVAMARAFARLVLVMGAAPVLAPILGAQLLRVTSWRGVFVALSVAGLLMLIFALRLLKETLPPERRRPGSVGATLRTFRLLLRDRPYLFHALAGGFSFAAMFAYISGSPFVLQQVYGLSPQQFSIAFGLNAVAFVGMAQVGARLVHRTGARALLLTGTSMQVTGAVVIAAALGTGAGLPGLLPGLFLVVGSVGFTAPNATALALAEHSAIAGSASALLGLGQYVLGGTAAPLVGLAGKDTAVPMAVVIGVGAVLALTAALLAGRSADPHEVDLEAELPAA